MKDQVRQEGESEQDDAQRECQGEVALARFEDDRDTLMSYGIDKVFNFFIEAGVGFAEDSLRLIGRDKRAET